MGRSWTSRRSAMGSLADGPKPAEALQGVVDLNGHRFLGEIAAGANQGPRDGFHQQVVQRRVGQHHAEIRVAWGNILGNVMSLAIDVGTIHSNPKRQRGCEVSPALMLRVSVSRSNPPPQQENRRCGRKQLAGLVFRNMAASPHGVERGKHQGKGPVGAVFSAPQTIDGIGSRGVHEELKAAESLQGHDLARRKGLYGRLQGFVALGLEPALRHPRAATAARTAGKQSAGRESGDRPGRHTRPGTRGRGETGPSRSAADRRAIGG